MTGATEQGTDDQRPLAAEEVREIAGGHFEYQDENGEPGLQQQDLRQRQAAALEKEHDDGHQHHERLQEREGEHALDVAFQLSGGGR